MFYSGILLGILLGVAATLIAIIGASFFASKQYQKKADKLLQIRNELNFWSNHMRELGEENKECCASGDLEESGKIINQMAMAKKRIFALSDEINKIVNE